MAERERPGERYRLLGIVPREALTQARREAEDTAFTWPHLLVRHTVVALATTAFTFLLAILFNAPLKEIANPNLTPLEVKAPWYFVGLQELLAHLHPTVAGVFVPSILVFFLLALPYLDRNPSRRATGRKVAIVFGSLMVALFLGLTLVGMFFRGAGWSWVWPWQPGHYVEF